MNKEQQIEKDRLIQIEEIDELIREKFHGQVAYRMDISKYGGFNGYTPLCTYDISKALYNAGYRKIDENCAVITKAELKEYKRQAVKEFAEKMKEKACRGCEEKKKIEVRKTALKNLPQDIAFYMSKDEKSFAKIPKEFQEKYREHFGKIGMRVVCNKVATYPRNYEFGYEISENEFNETALTAEQFVGYDNGGMLYGWHISDLKIYDKPKELSEFTSPRVCCNYIDLPAYRHVGCNMCKYSYTINCMIKCRIDGREPLTRPPQSYMYVKELKR